MHPAIAATSWFDIPNLIIYNTMYINIIMHLWYIYSHSYCLRLFNLHRLTALKTKPLTSTNNSGFRSAIALSVSPSAALLFLPVLLYAVWMEKSTWHFTWNAPVAQTSRSPTAHAEESTSRGSSLKHDII